jgi:hypothetical protein
MESTMTQRDQRQSTDSRDDRVLIGTRLAAGFVIFILVLAVAVLYFHPDQTDQYFAWTVKPVMTPLAMGAGYAMGAYFFLRVMLSNRWHRAAPGFLAITAFTIAMLLATLLHWDRFHQGTWAFALWFIVYLITPVLVPLLWLRNRFSDPRTPEANDVSVPIWVRRVTGLGGAAICLFAVAVFLLPDLAIGMWPWQLTPLTARVLAGWLILVGVGGLVLSREAWWSAGWRLLIESAAVGAILLLIGAARTWSDWHLDNLLNVGILLLVVVSLALLIAFYGLMAWRQNSLGSGYAR